MHSSTQHSAERERTLAAIRYDIAARIRPLCVGWAEADIVALIERMALIKYKYDTR